MREHDPLCRWAAMLNDTCLTCESIRQAEQRGYERGLEDGRFETPGWAARAMERASAEGFNQHGDGENP
jgi:flagellar biosynthesis/type III secretory pathway protein FliH